MLSVSETLKWLNQKSVITSSSWFSDSTARTSFWVMSWPRSSFSGRYPFSAAKAFTFSLRASRWSSFSLFLRSPFLTSSGMTPACLACWRTMPTGG